MARKAQQRSALLAAAVLWMVVSGVGCEFGTEVFTDKEIKRIETKLTDSYEYLNPPTIRSEGHYAVVNRLVFKSVDVGSSRFKLTLTEEGDVFSVECLRSTGSHSADKSLLTGMRKWKYNPATNASGHAAQCEITVTIYVELKTREL